MKKIAILTAVIFAIFAGSAYAKTPVKVSEKNISQTVTSRDRSWLYRAAVASSTWSSTGGEE